MTLPDPTKNRKNAQARVSFAKGPTWALNTELESNSNSVLTVKREKKTGAGTAR
jgi:hypothetical protein